MDISKISTHSVKNTKKLGKISSGEGNFSLEETAEIIKSAAPSEIKFSGIDDLLLNLLYTGVNILILNNLLNLLFMIMKIEK